MIKQTASKNLQILSVTLNYFSIHPLIATYCKLNFKKLFPIRTVLLFTVLPPFAVIDSFGKDRPIAQSLAESAKELIASLGPK
jgi:hypothetical protein